MCFHQLTNYIASKSHLKAVQDQAEFCLNLIIRDLKQMKHSPTKGTHILPCDIEVGTRHISQVWLSGSTASPVQECGKWDGTNPGQGQSKAAM